MDGEPGTEFHLDIGLDFEWVYSDFNNSIVALFVYMGSPCEKMDLYSRFKRFVAS